MSVDHITAQAVECPGRAGSAVAAAALRQDSLLTAGSARRHGAAASLKVTARGHAWGGNVDAADLRSCHRADALWGGRRGLLQLQVLPEDLPALAGAAALSALTQPSLPAHQGLQAEC